jgi:hypothetical protein
MSAQEFEVEGGEIKGGGGVLIIFLSLFYVKQVDGHS